MRRILIIGCCGAGKSTFAKKLHKKLGIELIILDRFFWKPNWQRVNREDWVEKIKEFIQEDSWIIDGNHNNTLDMRIERADTIIFFDFSRWRCVWNSAVRYVKGKFFFKKRDCLACGCKEKLDLDYLKWVWNYNKKVRPEYLEKLKELEGYKNIVHITSYSQAEIFLNKLQK